MEICDVKLLEIEDNRDIKIEISPGIDNIVLFLIKLFNFIFINKFSNNIVH